jgi:hypothetical protein
VETITLFPTASAHDAREIGTGVVSVSDTELILTSGLHWSGLWVDATAYASDLPGKVTAATLHYYPRGTGYDTPNLTWYGEAANSAAVFTTADYNISSRTPTAASASDVGSSVGGGKRSIDITSIVQEITSLPGWSGPIALQGDCAGGVNLRIYAHDNGSSIWSVEIEYQSGNLAALMSADRRRRVQ